MGPSLFDVLKHVDQGKVFSYVHGALAKGKCLGVRYVLRATACATLVDKSMLWWAVGDGLLS